MTTVLDQLQNISRDLDAAIRDLSRLEQEAANAESDYRVTKAKAFMRASGSVQAREYQAVIDSEIHRTNPGRSFDMTAFVVYEGWDALKALGVVVLIGAVFFAWFMSRMDGS